MDPTMHTRADDGTRGLFRRSRPRRRAVGAVVAVVGIIAGLLISGPLAGATPTYKFYTSAAGPSPIYVGATTTITTTLANSANSNQPFGSAELTIGSLPSSAVTNIGVPSGWSATFASTNPAIILLTSTNSASILPGHSLVVTFSLTPTTAASIPIATVVKQSNDFSGTGNNFNNSGHDPVIQVIPVTIAFQQEPSDVATDTTSPNHFMCPPVSVLVTAGTVPVAGISVTITNGGPNDPGLHFGANAVTAAGVTRTSDSNGLATFGAADCSSGFTGTNLGASYTLSANSSAASGAITSSTFAVVQSIVSCSAGATCNSGNLNSPTNGTSGTINSDTFGTPGKLLGSFGQGGLSCDNQVTTSAVTADPLDFQSIGTAVSGIVTLTFPKAVVNNLANNGTPLMQVCAGASASFPGSTDLGAGVTPEFQGLVANCTTGYTGVPNNICVLSRSKNAANETIQLFVQNLSDPHAW